MESYSYEHFCIREKKKTPFQNLRIPFGNAQINVTPISILYFICIIFEFYYATKSDKVTYSKLNDICREKIFVFENMFFSFSMCNWKSRYFVEGASSSYTCAAQWKWEKMLMWWPKKILEYSLIFLSHGLERREYSDLNTLELMFISVPVVTLVYANKFSISSYIIQGL